MWRHCSGSCQARRGAAVAVVVLANSSSSRCLPSSFPLMPPVVMLCSHRASSTGEHHTYRPGPLARVIRALFTALTPSGLRSRIALRLQVGLERVEVLEKEQQWLLKHGSPLAVMGLPDHAELEEVKRRYRDLVLETHPDTSKPTLSDSSSSALSTTRTTTAVSPSASTESTHSEVHAPRPLKRQNELSATDEYHLLQAAYRMTMNPESLWHRSGSAPALHDALTAHRSVMQRARTSTNLFAIACYAWMLFLGIVLANKAFALLCDKGLQLADPEFHAFMTAQEKEEQRKRDAGEFVDVDPLRLAPTAVRKLAYPGRFIHGTEMTPEREHLAAQQHREEQVLRAS